ncbi:MAG: serine/threonine protein kinase [Phycisphaerales bacterium]|nr:serine/threonine protein kinase [Phycisphaerales bacterium]MCI0676534.1 serine/threonine protein kinase [Phycisphaerales bacterium]
MKLEDTSEGSTEAVANSGTPAAAGAGPAAPSASSAKGPQDRTIKPLSAESELVTSESSTGGFETMLGTLVVESGLVSPDEMELCNSLLRESASSDEPRTLADLLLENEFLTQRQLQRMRGEFEAKRSSQRIPGYRIQSKLGSGAMATVFLADQISLDRPVAIKVLPKKFSDNVKFIERFYKEGRAAAKLNHPNIVAAYDVGQAGEHHYFVMEYIDGPTVYDRLVKNKRMDEQLAIRTTIQVAKALQHAHARGFIHRDIKPKNIMFNSQGVVKLADLGLARALSDKEAAKAEAGRAYGTPYYISPEQIRGEIKIGPQADIYGLGATFYHMVTGRVPFEGKNPSAVMHQHLKAELTPPDHLNPKLSPATAQVIEMMMSKDPAERYQNATDLLQDLDLISRGQPPHFARNKFDLTEIATSIASDAIAPAQIVKHRPVKTGPSLAESPAFMIVMVILGLSVLVNIVLALMLAG